MKALPTLFAQMRADIVPARVPPIHATTVAKQNAGVMSIVNGMILPQAKVLDAADQAALKAAAENLRKASDGRISNGWIRCWCRSAKGDFRVGAKLFDERLVFTLNSSLTAPGDPRPRRTRR